MTSFGVFNLSWISRNQNWTRPAALGRSRQGHNRSRLQRKISRKGAKERQKSRQQEFTTETQRTLRSEAKGRIKSVLRLTFAALRLCVRLLLTEHELLLGADVLVKPGRSQGPSCAIKSAHQFPDQATPVILNG